MAFQFQCPQCANVLQAEEFQAGQQSYCPMCGAMLLIPAPFVAPASPPASVSPYGSYSTTAYPPGPAPSKGYPQAGPAPAPGFPQLGPAPPLPSPEFPPMWPDDGGHAGTSPPQPPAPAFELSEPELLHIPCPQCKKMLETPVEMLDQDVMCPRCQAQFQLRRRDSVEFKRKKEQEAQIKEFKAGKNWLSLAIVVVVLVVLFLGGLIVLDVFGKA
jgi:Zn finger protein HypA/HybF involved in hydrogenase expression